MSQADIIEIQPQELKFVVERKKQTSCLLQLINKTDQHVAFKVKTTHPDKYCVSPNAGFVMPRSARDVTVKMQAQRELPPDLKCKDKFLIQSATIDSSVVTKEITNDMFTKEEGKIIQERKLGVIYVSPPQPPSPIPEEPEEGTSAPNPLENGNFNASLYDAVAKVAEEAKEKSAEGPSMTEKLNAQKASAVQQNKRLREEVEQLRKERISGNGGFSIVFVALVGILGILVGFLVKMT